MGELIVGLRIADFSAPVLRAVFKLWRKHLGDIRSFTDPRGIGYYIDEIKALQDDSNGRAWALSDGWAVTTNFSGGTKFAVKKEGDDIIYFCCKPGTTRVHGSLHEAEMAAKDTFHKAVGEYLHGRKIGVSLPELTHL